jgi:aspartate beta-hydroxylase
VSRDLFPSLYQRSIFNQPDLRASPWWTLSETGYLPHLQPIIDNFANITSEVIPALLGGAQTPPRVFPLYSQGKKNAENCRKVSLTCSLLERVPEATSCRHGETKFLVVPPNSHVPPHTGQTNTRLVVVMGLNLGEGELVIRLGEEKRVLKEGQTLVFDDSFEQELWFHSPRPGLVLSMDVWHPDLPPDTRKKLHPIH